MLNLHQLPTAISIHAPLREREEWRLAHWKMLSFQSTLPYGSESSRQKHYTINLFQSTLPYGSDKRKDVRDKEQQISIHAPLRERSTVNIQLPPLTIFQSTLPYGSDQKVWSIYGADNISIHAPLRERMGRTSSPPCWSNFNPRSLTGANNSCQQSHQRI